MAGAAGEAHHERIDGIAAGNQQRDAGRPRRYQGRMHRTPARIDEPALVAETGF
jgi:hypothetical protein